VKILIRSKRKMEIMRGIYKARAVIVLSHLIQRPAAVSQFFLLNFNFHYWLAVARLNFVGVPKQYD
jgi:hypothetical protein